MPWITPTQNTLLKLRPIDSKQLGVNEFRQRKAGDRLGVVAVRKGDNNHWQVRLAGDLTIGNAKTRELFIWPGHWDGAAAALVESLDAARAKAIGLRIKPALSIANGKVLDIAYKSQLDNRNNPTGSCNVTSAAICLEYWGITAKGSGQLEDEMYEWLEREGLSRHDPNHLKIAIEHWGARDDFTTRASIAEMKRAIDNGNPVIVHGYFTSFGHIIVLIGYNDKGFVCHDPYGEWTSGGYDRNNSSNPKKGEAIVYSYGLIERTCLPDGGCWAHVVTRPGVVKSTPVVAHKPVQFHSAPPKSDAIAKAVRAMAHPELPEQEIIDLIKACGEWLPKFGITTRYRIIHFFAQCAHESMGFYWLEEQGNHAYFTENYEGRSDLGNTQPGDGAKFSGHGLIQVTGRANHTNVAKKTGIDCVNNPKLLAQYPGALAGSLVWWQDNDMNTLCDGGLDDADVISVTKRINGGTNGLNDRLNRTDKLKLIVL